MQFVARMDRYHDNVAYRIDLHRVVIGDPGQLVRKVVSPMPERSVAVVPVRAEADEGVASPIIARMSPDNAARCVPGGPAARVQDRRWMPRTMPPSQRVEVEKMR